MKITTKELQQIIKEELETVIGEKASKRARRRKRQKRRKKKAKKDACYHKVKSRYKVWPSAYASGALVKCRKVGAKNWGNKSESLDEEVTPEEEEELKKVSDELAGASEMHGKQSKRIKDAIDEEIKDCMDNKTFDGKVRCIMRTKNISNERAKAYVASVLRSMGELDEDKIPGGYGDKLKGSMEDQHKQLADMHKVSVEEIEKELSKGIEVEMEHTDDEAIAHEIAMEHVYEDPEYYTKLSKAKLEENKALLKDPKVSKHLKYHIKEGVGVDRNVFRPDSDSFYRLFREVRKLHSEGRYTLNENEKHYILETDIGKFGVFEGERVPLDHPMLNEEKDPPIGKPMKNSDGEKKYKVFVRNPKTGNIKKITYGDKKGGLKGNWNSAEARESFAARHKCADKKDRMSSGYWACRAHKDFGKNVPGRFW